MKKVFLSHHVDLSAFDARSGKGRPSSQWAFSHIAQEGDVIVPFRSVLSHSTWEGVVLPSTPFFCTRGQKGWKADLPLSPFFNFFYNIFNVFYFIFSWSGTSLGYRSRAQWWLCVICVDEEGLIQFESHEIRNGKFLQSNGYLPMICWSTACFLLRRGQKGGFHQQTLIFGIAKRTKLIGVHSMSI